MSVSIIAYTDDNNRMIQWDLELDRGETLLLCSITFNVSRTFENASGATRTKGSQIRVTGKGATAQVAYDAALTLLPNAIKAEMKRLETEPEAPTTDITPEQGQHGLFGKGNE